jgi:uncharacterized damage-inducible protein DinB
MATYGAKEMAAAFRTVRGNTIAIANELNEDQFGFRPAEGSRTMKETLVHIGLISTLAEQIHGERMTTLEGFNFPAFVTEMQANEQRPRSKAEVVALLQENGDRFAAFLEGVSDDFLAEKVTFPFGDPKTRFEMLLSIKEHEMHHRGQLMLAQRLLGITPHLTRQMQERFAAMQQQAAAAKTAA